MDLYDDIRGWLPIQFLTTTGRALLECCYQTEFREAYCEIRISSPMYIVVAFDKFKYIVEGNIYLYTFGLFMMAWASILFLHC